MIGLTVVIITVSLHVKEAVIEKVIVSLKASYLESTIKSISKGIFI